MSMLDAASSLWAKMIYLVHSVGEICSSRTEPAKVKCSNVVVVSSSQHSRS